MRATSTRPLGLEIGPAILPFRWAVAGPQGFKLPTRAGPDNSVVVLSQGSSPVMLIWVGCAGIVPIRAPGR